MTLTVNQITKNSNKFVANITATIENIVDNNPKLEALNKKQLSEGKRADGSKIEPQYSASYAAWKSKAAPSNFKVGVVNLLLSGFLYKNIEIRAKGLQYNIVSLVSYGAKLLTIYGLKIFGIAPENRPRAQSITTKELARRYKKEVLQR